MDRRMRAAYASRACVVEVPRMFLAAGNKNEVRRTRAGRGRDGRDSVRMSGSTPVAKPACFRRTATETASRDWCATGQRSCSRSYSMDNRRRRFPAPRAPRWRRDRRYAHVRRIHAPELLPPTRKAPFPQVAPVRAERLQGHRAMPRNNSFFFSCCRCDEILCDYLVHARHSIHFRHGLYSGDNTVNRAR